MKCLVTALRPKDRLCQNSEPIAAIYRDMGTKAAEQVVSRALSELAMTMVALARQVRGHDMADLPRQLRRLQRMAEHLGMVSFGQVAGDARAALEGGDGTAFAAVWARLLRVAEASLATDHDLRDQSI